MNKELTTIRQNMIDDVSYRPYCGNGEGCSWPRVNKDFICPECGFKLYFEEDFFKRYKEKHNL